MTEEEKEAAQGNLLRCMIKKCDASAWVPPICCDFVENQAAITGTCTAWNVASLVSMACSKAIYQIAVTDDWSDTVTHTLTLAIQSVGQLVLSLCGGRALCMY